MEGRWRRRAGMAAVISVAAAIGSAACEPPELGEPPPPVITGDVKYFLQDLNTNVVFRGATLTIFNPEGSYGHGYLLEDGANLYLHTLAHVGYGVKDSYVHFPGLDLIGKIDPRKFIPDGTSIRSVDPAVRYLFDKKFQERLRLAIQEGKITAIRLATEKPVIGNWVAVPRTDTGKYSYYTITDYQARTGEIILDSAGYGIACAGRSGNPILRVDQNRTIINESFGLLGRGDEGPEFLSPDVSGMGRSPCSRRIYIRPNTR